MSKVFVSSLVAGYESYRQAARDAIGLMDHSPRMCEDFGARAYSSEQACIHEVEQSDIYILIMGAEYGFLTPDGISVTHAEYSAAKAINRPILAFIQNCSMDEQQRAFKSEVEEYQAGSFRASFTTPVELKDEIIKALRQMETMTTAISEVEFNERIKVAINVIHRWGNDEPEIVMAFLPQPDRMVDIIQAERELDDKFNTLCAESLAQLRDGYKPITAKNWTGLKTEKLHLAQFADGLILLVANPTVKDGSSFWNVFAPPERVETIAKGFRGLLSAQSGYMRIGLRNMGNVHVAEVPASSSISIRMFGDEEEHFDRLFAPMTVGAYEEWLGLCIGRFTRTFRYGNDN